MKVSASGDHLPPTSKRHQSGRELWICTFLSSPGRHQSDAVTFLHGAGIHLHEGPLWCPLPIERLRRGANHQQQPPVQLSKAFGAVSRGCHFFGSTKCFWEDVQKKFWGYRKFFGIQFFVDQNPKTSQKLQNTKKTIFHTRIRQNSQHSRRRAAHVARANKSTITP